MTSPVSRGSGLSRLYFRSYRVLSAFSRVLSAAFVGFWLGVLTRRQLLAIGERHYGRERMYWTEEYNKQGLSVWEERVVERDFSACRTLLVAAAGGGREVLALRRLGYEVHGFEADPGLVRVANGLLEREGMVPDIQQAPWDHCPDIEGTYAGIIVGWGAYMLIRGRGRRIAFLRELRERVTPGAPILLSFYSIPKDTRYFRVIARIGNSLARVLRRDPVQVGDCLAPNYTHFFTKERAESELVAGGFEPVSFEHLEYGHAVGRAV
jgi:hypothetical protein